MFQLKDVVPWGRSLDEYRRMFALSDADMAGRILGCADGPASFNAEASRLGCRVVSCDPLYRFSVAQIRERIDQTFQTVIDQTVKNAAEFVWSADIPTVAALGASRMAAMSKFLDDCDAGKATGRYVDAELPSLPFADDSFDISVCSHFLFLYSAQFSEDFHIESILELCRVSREVRLFPLLELGSVPSRHVAGVVRRLQANDYHVRIERVDYEFQRGGNQMMRVRR
jgi:hypothetical protein